MEVLLSTNVTLFVYRIAGIFRGLKFRRLAVFGFRGSICTQAPPTSRKCDPSLDANALDLGIKIFMVNIFADGDQSAKSTKNILTRKSFQLYGSFSAEIG